MKDEFTELVVAMADSWEPIRTARVIRVDSEGVWLDVGSKFESMLPLSDWEEADSLPGVGDAILVFIDGDLAVDDRPLNIVRVTRHPGPRPADRAFLVNARPCDIHTGRIRRRIKNGFLVDIGVLAFLPDEQAPAALLADPGACIGQTATWRVTKVDLERLCIQIAPA